MESRCRPLLGRRITVKFEWTIKFEVSWERERERWGSGVDRA